MKEIGTQKVIRVHSTDNVAVALQEVAAGEQLMLPDQTVIAVDAIPFGHKIALCQLDSGTDVRKFGAPFGVTTCTIARGAHVHTHNVSTSLSAIDSYTYEPHLQAKELADEPATALTFQGYRRSDGRVATRNEIWIVSTVGCVSRTADRIAAAAAEQFAGKVDGIYSIKHPYGCSQLGDDLEYTQTILAGLIDHPNAGGVLVLGLGCETNQLASLLTQVSGKETKRIRYFNAQAVDDELAAGVEAIAELVQLAKQDRRVECPLSELTIGLKCGGSDGFSGLSANPLLGKVWDKVTRAHGRAILTEIPEMFGAERQLMNRCVDQRVFGRLVNVVNDFKQYLIDHGQTVYENPSPGNSAGGITTLEEKSLGATQKAGASLVSDVLRYGEAVRKTGLSILEAPGNDGVSSTAMVAGGATVLLFTTGRGTPLGFPVPTIKVSSNSAIAAKKPHWIDFNAGELLQGADLDKLADELLAKVLKVASGEWVCNEISGEREIAIWKRGVTL